MFKKVRDMLWKQNPETDITGYREPDPDDLSIDNAYKTRWIWYHTFMAVELLIIIMLLLGILIVLGIKL
jgi:hypothetical protein|tara:strand:- start:363 stop:569 length:207 start_codon:yes stop_codon:yes gene_type:complete